MTSKVDLRSDTVTQPTEGMRAAMASAPLGDDVFGDDPSVNALQEKIAAMLGFEAALFVPTGTQSNLCAILDFNRLQIDGAVLEVMCIAPVAEKWSSFGWEVMEVDGHDLSRILPALDRCEQIKDRPSLIIAHTIKGKGVSFMENQVRYHGIAPTQEELGRALTELGA